MISVPHAAVLTTVLATASLAGGCGADPPSAATPAERTYKVEAARAATEDVRVTLRAVGTVRASEKADIRPQVDGVVAEILYEQGSTVAEGDMLVVLDDRKAAARLMLEKAALDSAKAAHKFAGLQHARNKRLIEQELVSQEEYDLSESAFLEAAADRREREAGVVLRMRELDEYHLDAPFSGIVGERLVDVGNYVERGTALVALLKVDPIEIDFELPDRHAGSLAVGTTVTISQSAGRGSVTGAVSFVDPRVDPDTRMLNLRADVANADGLLRDGQFVEISVLLGVHENQVVIPEEAVLLTEGKTWVFVVEDGRAHRRAVTLGERLPPLVEVLDGLSEHAELVVGGQHRLSEGALVEVLDEPARGGA